MPWFVIYTKSRQEKKVADQLNEIGITAFCPMITSIKQWSDRKKKTTVPLINSYVFVQLEETDRFKVFEVSGAVRYVHWLKKPAVVRDSEIQSLKELTEKTVSSFAVDYLKKDDEFQIPTGAFKDKVGLIQEVRSKSVKIKLVELGLILTVQVEE